MCFTILTILNNINKLKFSRLKHDFKVYVNTILYYFSNIKNIHVINSPHLLVTEKITFDIL